MRAHTAKVIGLEMRRTCNTDATRATGWTASMSDLVVHALADLGVLVDGTEVDELRRRRVLHDVVVWLNRTPRLLAPTFF
jgi:hypothetical protein